MTAQTKMVKHWSGIHPAEDGWFWLIPLQGGITSIGFVGNHTEGAVRKLYRFQPLRRLRTAGATMVSDILSMANYSYRAGQGNGDGFLMIGDAYGLMENIRTLAY